jgi:cobalamin biosynthesis Mg chelatase CobN
MTFGCLRSTAASVATIIVVGLSAWSPVHAQAQIGGALGPAPSPAPVTTGYTGPMAQSLTPALGNAPSAPVGEHTQADPSSQDANSAAPAIDTPAAPTAVSSAPTDAQGKAAAAASSQAPPGGMPILGVASVAAVALLLGAFLARRRKVR